MSVYVPIFCHPVYVLKSESSNFVVNRYQVLKISKRHQARFEVTPSEICEKENAETYDLDILLAIQK